MADRAPAGSASRTRPVPPVSAARPPHPRAGREFGDGPLSRAAATVHALLVVELSLVIATLPGLVPLLLLDRDASNIPLAVACGVPVGPAVSAAVYALRHQRPDLTDLRPAALFWRGYRANLGGVLCLWVPLLLWLAVIAVNLTNLGAAGVPAWWGALLVAVAVAALVAGGNALVIASLFAFRTRDVVRLAVYFLVRTPAVAAGNACLLLLAAGIVVAASEAVLTLLGSVLTLAFLRMSTPIVDAIEREFTR
ncbi:DUF624 domain-containing protein [Plantactinospora sp. GCM10030261]|uniref:DUF624 domain-containing protein n=1 Tax=Plantactinospora sp. GCM10030261 TaxID=3273420 RepID=UPI00361927BC